MVPRDERWRRLDWATLEITLKAYLQETRERLDPAASIATAARACAETDNVEKGVPPV